MSAKRHDRQLGELMAVIADYLSAGEDDTDLAGRVRCWLEVAEGRVCESDTAGRLAGLEVVDRRKVLVDLVIAQREITTTQLAKGSAICPETARLFLRKLAARKIMRRLGDKRGARWVASRAFIDYARDLGYSVDDIRASGEASGRREGVSEASPVAIGDTLALSEA